VELDARGRRLRAALAAVLVRDNAPELSVPSRTPARCATLFAAMSQLTDLDAFFTDHLRCGDLDSGVDGDIVWSACDCGASTARRTDVHDDVRPT